MTISLAQMRSKPYSDMYPERPVWAVVSHAVASNSPMVAMYGERSPFVPLGVEAPGVARFRAGRAFVDEAANSAYHFLGIATNPNLGGPYSLLSGMTGVSNFSQTGCLANFEISDNGTFGWYNAITSEADKLAARAGVIVGEKNWRQCFDLVLAEDLKMYKDEIGGGYLYTRSGNRPFIDFAAIFTSMGTSAGGNAGVWGVGQIAHNRKSKRLMVAQPRGGTSGSGITFRLHFFDLQNAIGRDTTVTEIRDWVAACVADQERYRYVDVTLSSARCHYANDSTYDAAGTRFVLCDNDELWVFKSSETGSTGAAYGNALFRVNLSGGNWKTGQYGATEAIGFSNATQYGLTNGPYLGARHINSDDNSVIALFQHNYYYNAGVNLAMVSTKDAGATSFNYAVYNANNGSFAIAPSGGADFVLCQTNANNDTVGPRLAFMSNETVNATQIPFVWQTNIWPSVGSSTMYGANIVVKVQPTTEWK